MDAKQIAKGIAEGVGSLPTSLGYSIRRTWEGSGVVGSSLKERNFRETERFVSLIRSAVDKQEPIRKLVMIVINDFYAKLDAGSKSAVAGEINRAEGFIAGRSVTQFFIASKIASNIIRKASYGLVYKRFIKYSTTTILNVVMFQGMIEEAALASRRMQMKFPKTFYKIRGMNLDMAYFLVEGFLEPYLIYINNSSNQFCAGVNHELAKILSCEVR